jgi:hypothetical protein
MAQTKSDLDELRHQPVRVFGRVRRNRLALNALAISVSLVQRRLHLSDHGDELRWLRFVIDSTVHELGQRVVPIGRHQRAGLSHAQAFLVLPLDIALSRAKGARAIAVLLPRHFARRAQPAHLVGSALIRAPLSVHLSAIARALLVHKRTVRAAASALPLALHRVGIVAAFTASTRASFDVAEALARLISLDLHADPHRRQGSETHLLALRAAVHDTTSVRVASLD